MTASNAAEGEDVGDDKGSNSPPDDKELTAADPDDPTESLLGEVRREAKLLELCRHDILNLQSLKAFNFKIQCSSQSKMSIHAFTDTVLNLV